MDIHSKRVEHLNAKVVFCDIDLKTFNIDVNQIEEKISPKTKAIIPVHLFGLSVHMGPILDIAQKYNLGSRGCSLWFWCKI